MAETIEGIIKKINIETTEGFRDKLVARGLARAMIWADGTLPDDSPSFSTFLSYDLLSYGFALLSQGLRLRGKNGDQEVCIRAFERAGESLESVVNKGNPLSPERGFYRIIAAAAYHLGHFSARAFSLLSDRLESLNLSPSEQILAFLILRDFRLLRQRIMEWFESDNSKDDYVSARLTGIGNGYDEEDVLQIALTSQFFKTLALFDYSLLSGDERVVSNVIANLEEGINIASEFGCVSSWWLYTLTRHLIDDLWSHSLHVRLPLSDNASPESQWKKLRFTFIAILQRQQLSEIELWPSQLEAANRALDISDDLVVALPTSAGKTRIAEFCLLRSLSLGKRVVFVTPLRALAAQTERNLKRTFLPLGFTVSSLYGSSGATDYDVNTLGNRNIVVATPEKLDFALRNDPTLIDDVGLIILDEGHMIGTNEREIHYEVLVQRLLRRSDSEQRRIVCLSAILPPGEQLDDFVAWIRQDQPGKPISSHWRPTRQRFGEVLWRTDHAQLKLTVESETPYVNNFIKAIAPVKGNRKNAFPQNQPELTLATTWKLVEEGQTVLIYCPQRKSVEPLAKEILKLKKQGFLLSLIDSAEKTRLKNALNIGKEWLGETHPAVMCLKLGVAVHHGKLPRPFQREVEALLRNKVLKVTIASPTLAQGLNLSATTLLFHSIYRFGNLIPGEEFANVSGRAGRAYVDVEGQVLCVFFDSSTYKINKWHELLRSSMNRDMRSGLVRLALHLIDEIVKRTGFSLDTTIDYIMGNAATWDAPQPTDEDPNIAKRWNAEIAYLDSAILSLVENLNCSRQDLAVVLDNVLTGSLWKRSLCRLNDEQEGLARAILLGRSNFIWDNSTAKQRKGYFAAGVGLSTGKFLDDNATKLADRLLTADQAVENGDLDDAISAITEFAEIVFQVEPFAPEDVPKEWKEILRCWIQGQSISELSTTTGNSKIVDFLEDALVYRLVWALDAIRVKSIAQEEEFADLFSGKAATVVEAGIFAHAACLLIQNGLSSRTAAKQALSDCPAFFTDIPGLRKWLQSEEVTRFTNTRDWPTPETADIWKNFRNGFLIGASEKWEHKNLKRKAIWDGGKVSLPPGTPVRLLVDKTKKATWIYSIEMNKLGHLEKPFATEPKGLMLSYVSDRPGFVSLFYVGPDDIVNTADRSL